jgi:hypothetical protein
VIKARIGDLVMFDETNNRIKTPWQNKLGIIIEMRPYARCVVHWPDGGTSMPELRILEVLNKCGGASKNK